MNDEIKFDPHKVIEGFYESLNEIVKIFDDIPKTIKKEEQKEDADRH